jgi:hypothetical protein
MAMSAAAAARPAAPVRRAALLAALLAVIAGFLGMHILSGSHGLHAQASPPASMKTPTAAHPAGVKSSRPGQVHPAGHSSHAAAGTASQSQDGSAVAGTAPSATPAAATDGGTQVPPSCLCQGGCTDKPAAHIGCTPSPAGATLSAPQPGAGLPAVQSWTAAMAARQPDYAYLPTTPTPRDLSISRT